jgi:hypothetical protein
MGEYHILFFAYFLQKIRKRASLLVQHHSVIHIDAV